MANTGVLFRDFFYSPRRRDLKLPFRCLRFALPPGRPLRTPSQKHLASSATGGASVLLPAPYAALRCFCPRRTRRSGYPSLFRTKKRKTIGLPFFVRRRRDLNPRAAINDLLPFQGSPFSHLGTSPKTILNIITKNMACKKILQAKTERVGFEPTRPFGQTVFKTASL